MQSVRRSLLPVGLNLSIRGTKLSSTLRIRYTNCENKNFFQDEPDSNIKDKEIAKWQKTNTDTCNINKPKITV